MYIFYLNHNFQFKHIFTYLLVENLKYYDLKLIQLYERAQVLQNIGY